MKKLLILTAVLLLSVAPAAMAGNYVKGTVGYFSPTDSDFDGALDLAVAGGVDLKEMTGVPVKAELGFGYNAPSASIGGVDVDSTVYALTLTGLYELPLEVPNMGFNVGAGVGLYMWDVDAGAFGGADGNDVGFHLQAGADYKLNEQVDLVADLRWAKVDFDNEDGGGTTIALGAKYNF